MVKQKKRLALSLCMVSICLTPELSLADASSLEVSGRIMIDAERYDGVHNKGEREDEIGLRRARLKLKYKASEHWQGKVQFAYSNSEDRFKINDASLAYTGWSFADLTLGKFKEPFSLENLTSSSNISTIERSMASSAFAPSYNYGLSLSSMKNKQTWAFGIFDAKADNDKNDAYAITGRYTKAFIDKKNNQLLHFGIAGSWRQGAEKQYKINESAEVYSANSIIDSTKLHADTIKQYGFEVAINHKEFSFQSELFKQDITVKPDKNDLNSSFWGHYLQASYRLTGESLIYKKGRFAGIKPRSTSGAWEVVARYSKLDAQDNDKGDVANNRLLGLNYYYGDNTRIMLNYITTELKEGDSNTPQDGKALSLRLQYRF